MTSRRARVALGLLVVGYAGLEAIAGAPRSPLVPPMPPGVSIPGWTARLARFVGADRLSVGAQIAIGLALMVGLLVAFGVVLSEAWRGRVAVGAVVATAVVSIALTTAGPLLLSRDVFSYAAYGRIVAIHGANPYLVAPARFTADPFTVAASPQWVGVPSLYGPAFTLLSATIARAWAGSASATIVAFKVLAGLCLVGTVGLVAGSRSWPAGRRAFAVAAIGVNPVLVVHAIGGGHNDALLALLLVAAAVLAAGSSQRETPAALVVTGLLSLATLVKVFALVPLMLWVWSRIREAGPGGRVRVVSRHVGLAAALAVVVSVPFVAGLKTFHWVATTSSVEGWASGPRLIARGARALGLGSAGARAVDAAFIAGFAVLFWLMLRRASRTDAVRAWAAALLVFALALPYLVPWYAAWFLPLAALALDGRLLRIGLVAAGLLAVTGIPADPTFAPAAWHAMVFAVHYIAAPLMLALLAFAAWTVWASTDKRLPQPGADGG